LLICFLKKHAFEEGKYEIGIPVAHQNMLVLEFIYLYIFNHFANYKNINKKIRDFAFLFELGRLLSNLMGQTCCSQVRV
jgi:hypothetical protein